MVLIKAFSPYPIYEKKKKNIIYLKCKYQFMDDLAKPRVFKTMSVVLVITVVSNINK